MPPVQGSHTRATYYKPQQGEFWVSAAEDSSTAVTRTTYNKEGVAKKHWVETYSAINAKLDSFIIRKITSDKGDFETLDVRFDTAGEVEVITMPWPSDQAKNMLMHLAVMQPGTMYHLEYYDIPKEKTTDKKRAVRGFKIQEFGMAKDDFIKRFDTRTSDSYPKPDEPGTGQRATLGDAAYWKVYFVVENAFLIQRFIPKLQKAYEETKAAQKEAIEKAGPTMVHYDDELPVEEPPTFPDGDDLPF